MINTDRDRLAKTLGFSVLSQREDFAEVSAQVREEFLNGVGIAHGGFLFSICDYAAALAANTPTRTAITSASTIDFIAPALPNSKITARAELSAATPKTGVYRVSVFDSENPSKIYAVYGARAVYK